MKILVVFGTRPEAIKMAPLIHELQNYPADFELKICITAQHRQMLDQVLTFFQITPDYDLNLMRPGQNLYQLTADVLTGMKDILEAYKPDYVLVHGDTTTSCAAALAGYYAGCQVGHVEAGLRTYNKWAPFPEEINRQLTGRLADIHLAPTQRAFDNLISEGVDKSKIVITGNTVVDALMLAQSKLNDYQDTEIDRLKQIVQQDKKLVLVTGHRRENFGDGFLDICHALKTLADEKDVQIIYPVHLNPNVQQPVYNLLSNHNSIHLIEPLGYAAFLWLMMRSYFIITDSGGIQEEAPSIRKPVLVMRESTERQEAVDAGVVKMVGTDKAKIVSEALLLLNNTDVYQSMTSGYNPYGDGQASKRIVEALLACK